MLSFCCNSELCAGEEDQIRLFHTCPAFRVKWLVRNGLPDFLGFPRSTIFCGHLGIQSVEHKSCTWEPVANTHQRGRSTCCTITANTANTATKNKPNLRLLRRVISYLAIPNLTYDYSNTRKKPPHQSHMPPQ